MLYIGYLIILDGHSIKKTVSEITSKRVVRSSAGPYAIYPPFWGSFAYDTPRYGTGCPTPCKIMILGEKMIPQ